MALDKKQQMRGVKIALTVFYGFLLSSTLFQYLIHGIIETIRRPTNPFAITKIALGSLILLSIATSIYTTWNYKKMVTLVSGIVLIIVFGLTLVFGVINIVKTAPHRTITVKPLSNVVIDVNDSLGVTKATLADQNNTISDTYALAEDITKLIVELIAILFAILGTFILYRYVQEKYASVATSEPKPA